MNQPIQVLMVEDVEDDARLLAAELKRGGYDVTFERVDTAAAMRAALQRQTWDVILCDFTMPYFSGEAALRLAQEAGPDVPFIYVSGTIGEDIAIEAMKSGAQDYIMKTNMARLAPAIARELHEAQIRRESRQAEAAMRASEHKYRHLFEALSDAVFVIDEASGRIIDTNTRAEHLVGRTRTDILGSNQTRLLAPENGQPGFAALRAAATGEHPGGCELEVLRHDGHHVPVHASASRIELYGRQLLLTMMRDVSERNRMDEQLRQLSRAVEQSPASIVITDPAGNITYVNPKFTAVTGYAYAEAIGKNPRILKSGETTPETYAGLWQTITSGREWRGEFHNRKKSGELFWELVLISPIVNVAGQTTHFLAVKEDITARKQDTARICEQARLLDLAQEAIHVRDLEDRITYWNPSAERFYGWTAAEAVGKTVGQLIPGEIPGFAQAKKSLLETGGWQGELTVTGKTGRVLNIETRWTLVRNADGTPRSVLDISTDITERKKNEAQFLRSQRMENIGQLAGGIAHDLNNILAPILLSVQLLREEVKTPHGDSMLAMLEAGTRRGAEIVKQLLTFARGVEGQHAPLQPLHLVKEMAQIIRETVPQSITLNTHAQPGGWLVDGDATQLHQVLLNLAVNARDAMPHGGTLELALDEVTLDAVASARLPAAKPGPYVRLKVADTGTGIAPAIRDKMFDPFFTTKSPGKGTGLGLSTVLGIVKSHGGFLQVESTVGRGTEFQVYLPAITGAAALAGDKTPPAPPLGQGKKILIVDDEAAVRTVIKRILEAHDYRTLTASNGLEAVALYAEQGAQIDVVVTDLDMPGLDGRETIAAIRKLNPQARMVVITGAEGELPSPQELHVPDFLKKPFTALTLLNNLHDRLRT